MRQFALPATGCRQVHLNCWKRFWETRPQQNVGGLACCFGCGPAQAFFSGAIPECDSVIHSAGEHRFMRQIEESSFFELVRQPRWLHYTVCGIVLSHLCWSPYL